MNRNEIVSGIYIGDITSDTDFDGDRICVLENACANGCEHFPILQIGSDGQPFASSINLDRVADRVEQSLINNRKILVHCGAGVERSPLSVVWYLHKKKNLTIEEAYKFVMLKRPEAQDRRVWLSNYSLKIGYCQMTYKRDLELTIENVVKAKSYVDYCIVVYDNSLTDEDVKRLEDAGAHAKYYEYHENFPEQRNNYLKEAKKIAVVIG